MHVTDNVELWDMYFIGIDCISHNEINCIQANTLTLSSIHWLKLIFSQQ